MRAISQTLIDRALDHGQAPTRRIVLLDDRAEESEYRTVAALSDDTASIAGALHAHNACGARALVAAHPGPAFLSAFLACLHAGVIAVPVPLADCNRRLSRTREIVDECGARLLIGGEEAAPAAEELGLELLIPEDLIVGGAAVEARAVGPDDVAYLQFTSGTTGRARGVMVTHANVQAAVEALDARAGRPRNSWVVSWLPLYHDMGLITALFALYTGLELALARPESFTRNPWAWLHAITRYRACYSGAPNFAYELLNRTVPPGDIGSIELGNWTTAFCGAEPVQPRTLARFAHRFAGSGFQLEALSPGYGLAEFTLAATAVGFGQAPRTLKAKSAFGSAISSCGEPLDGHTLLVVDPLTHEILPAGETGEIWLDGPSKALGYWQREAESQQVFRANLADGSGEYLRTGDLGYIDDGQLFVVGRLKDLIIVRGRNLNPHDLESAALASHPALQGLCAAFSHFTEQEEFLTIVCEVRRGAVACLATDHVMQCLQHEIVRRFGTAVDEVALVRAGAVPRTTSGKVRRSECRRQLEAGDIRMLHHWVRERPDVQAGEPAWGGTAATGPADTPLPANDRVSITQWIARWLQVHLGIDEEEIDPRLPLQSFGLDSLHMLQLTHALEDWLALTLDETVAWREPTIEALSRRLEENLQPRVGGDHGHRSPLGAVELLMQRIESLTEHEVQRRYAVRVNQEGDDDAGLLVENPEHVQGAAGTASFGSAGKARG